MTYLYYDRPTTSMLSATLLAAMITLAPPGQSALSVLVDPSCGAAPGKPACDVRPAPSWSPFYKAFVRVETKDEALKRYALIARAIEKISVAMTTPTKRDDGTVEPPPWPGSAEDLARALVTIAHHESSFRRDVHSGVGPFALGDCAYWDRTGKRVPASQARKLGAFATSCQSVCLMQLNTGGLEGTRFGFQGKEMVGLDAVSTERCFAAGARALVEARARCAKTLTEGWFPKTVASYVTGDACETDAEWVTARVGTFTRVLSISDASLPREARALIDPDAARPPDDEAR
jgi:hypothetical protein